MGEAVSATEALVIIGCSEKTFRRLITKGELKPLPAATIDEKVPLSARRFDSWEVEKVRRRTRYEVKGPKYKELLEQARKRIEELEKEVLYLRNQLAKPVEEREVAPPGYDNDQILRTITRANLDRRSRYSRRQT